MGQSRRHGDLFDELGRQRIEEIALRPTPVSLTPEELNVDDHPVKSPGEGVGIRVRAWVRYPETVVDVAARGVRVDRQGRARALDGARRISPAGMGVGQRRASRRAATDAARSRRLDALFGCSESAGKPA